MHGVASSVGTVQFVPLGFPDAGAIRIMSYNGGGFYSGTLTSDGMGTFNLSNVMLRTNTGGGPEGLIYVPNGAPVFSGPSMLISEYSQGRVSAYQLDSNGIPIPATRQDFITGLSGAEGATLDPLTNDFLFSTFGGQNRSEEHTSELQSRQYLVCRLLLEKKIITSSHLIHDDMIH